MRRTRSEPSVRRVGAYTIEELEHAGFTAPAVDPVLVEVSASARFVSIIKEEVLSWHLTGESASHTIASQELAAVHVISQLSSVSLASPPGMSNEASMQLPAAILR